MLIQCDYQKDDFLVRNSTIYYQGVKVSPVNPAPLWCVGSDELYLFPTIFPLSSKCSWLVVVQSRFPVFYECKKIELSGEKVIITLTDSKRKSIKPFRDGVCDRLLVNDVYTV